MSHKARILAMLRRGPVTNAEMSAAFIPRYGGRIMDLRRDGFTIVTERISGSSFVYRLVSEPQRPTAPAPEPLEVAMPEAFDSGRLFDLPTLGAYSEAA